jgi:hypothetical protein
MRGDNVMPMNMFLAKRGASVVHQGDAGYGRRDGESIPYGEPDPFCGLPHVPGTVLKTFDWGEYFGD